MKNHLEAKMSDYEKSFKTFRSLLTTEYKVEAYPPVMAKNMTFGKEFPGSLISKPSYKNCQFIKTTFDSADGSLSRFHDCLFEDCKLINCDLRYCDIFHSSFQSREYSLIISSCNFSFGNFINSVFSNSSFTGCSFRQMQFENTVFSNCLMERCSIEQSNIKKCVFENLDLRKVGVRYCSFEETSFDSVIFHILDLAKNYGLIQELKKSNKSIVVAYENDKTMPLNAAIKCLQELVPYYRETQHYYELINVFAAQGEYERILSLLPIAFENVVTSCDFAALQDLCSLVVKLNICTDRQLRDFYVLIKQLIVPDHFPHYLRKSYNTYIENIKYILVDNPYNNPEAEILFKTNIKSLADEDMTKFLMAIEANIKEIAPEVDTIMRLTHHSPYDVVLTLCGAMPEILMACQIFYYCLGGTKSLSDLRNSKKEKAVKNTQPHLTKEKNKNKRIELSVGKIFLFKYEKEYTKRLESMEYTIK